MKGDGWLHIKSQHQISPHKINTLSREKIMRTNKMTPKENCFDLLTNPPNLYCRNMYGDLSGEFVCGYWG